MRKEDNDFRPDLINMMFGVPGMEDQFALEVNKLLNTIPKNSHTKKVWTSYIKLNPEGDSEEEILEDVIQDCWIHFLEHKDEIKTEKVSSFIITGAFYVLLSKVRDLTRERKRIISALVEDLNLTYSQDFDKLSDEELFKISQNLTTEVKRIYRRQTVVQLEKKTYRVIKEYSSLEEAANTTGINNSNISKVLRHKAKSAGGFIWFYSDDPTLKTVGER